MRLNFYGGAKTVTGANYLLEVDDLKILVDCGLFQGTRFSEELNYNPFAYNPSEIDYLLITHNHADHIGRIPKLYRDGFRGVILCTEPVREILPVALKDTLEHILDEAQDMGHPPLYKESDVLAATELIRGAQYQKPVTLNDSVTVIFHESSHILGAAILEIIVANQKRIIFTGDLGNPPAPLLNGIDYVKDADYVIIESAYGGRIHEDRDTRRDILQRVITETIQRGGVLMIPSFAVERIQELLLEIDILMEGKRIPPIPVYLDSPLAIRMTEIYGRFSSYFNAAAMSILKHHGGFFRFPWLTFTPTVQDSKRINDVEAPKIIIAGSGMSQGGRIIHHEMRYLPGADNTILFIGYQVEGSLGRRILNGEPKVRIKGEEVPVRCRIQAIGGYSAHADQQGLLKFVAKSNEGRGVKRVFVVQGEEASADALAQKITSDLNIPAYVPSQDETIDL